MRCKQREKGKNKAEEKYVRVGLWLGGDFSKNRRSAGRSFFFKGVRSLQSYDGYDETSLLLRVLARGTLLQRTL